jgi:hypothetical protein
MAEVPKRRWFRFSLRTLFAAVTLLSLPSYWLTSNVHLAHERWKLLRQPGVVYGRGRAGSPRMHPVMAEYGSLPLGLWSVGAWPLDTVELTGLWGNVFTPDDLKRYQLAFPEAKVTLPPASRVQIREIPRRRPIVQ